MTRILPIVLFIGVVAGDSLGQANEQPTVHKAYDYLAHYAPVLHIDGDCLYRPSAVNFDNDNDWGDQTKAYDRQRDQFAWPKVTYYCRVKRGKDESGTEGYVFDYWFYYVFNQHPVMSTKENTVLINKHDHDWERVFVFVPKLGKAPSFVWFNQHNWSQTHKWKEIKKYATKHRPALYVFNDGHASFGQPHNKLDGFRRLTEPVLGGSFDDVTVKNVRLYEFIKPIGTPGREPGTGYKSWPYRDWMVQIRTIGKPKVTVETFRLPRGRMPEDATTEAQGNLPGTPWGNGTWSLPLR